MNNHHICSLVLRKHLRSYQAHKQEAYSIYQSLSQDQKINVSDMVRIRYRKALIRKVIFFNFKDPLNSKLFFISLFIYLFFIFYFFFFIFFLK